MNVKSIVLNHEKKIGLQLSQMQHDKLLIDSKMKQNVA